MRRLSLILRVAYYVLVGAILLSWPLSYYGPTVIECPFGHRMTALGIHRGVYVFISFPWPNLDEDEHIRWRGHTFTSTDPSLVAIWFHAEIDPVGRGAWHREASIAQLWAERYFYIDPTGKTVNLPVWFVASIAAFPSLVFDLAMGPRRRRLRRINKGLCPTCGYDLRAHSPGDHCPECGTPIPTSTSTSPHPPAAR